MITLRKVGREKKYGVLKTRYDWSEVLGDECDMEYGGRAQCGRAQGTSLHFEVRGWVTQVEVQDWSTLRAH